MQFRDVHDTDYFYTGLSYLYCQGAISGYGDSTFRPYNNTTRGQLCKIAVLAEGWQLSNPSAASFRDVPLGSTFFVYVETAYAHSIISGYGDGTFRPYNNITRGQLCKVIVQAEGWPIDTRNGPHFSDVPTNHTFYNYVETACNRGIISGYGDGTFHPGNNATRGQICKTVYNAVTAP